MSIYKSAIEKPVTTALIFVAVIVIGLFSLSRLPIDQFPEMDPPYITVMTTYAGASASEIETNVTKLIENSLTSVDGLKEPEKIERELRKILPPGRSTRKHSFSARSASRIWDRAHSMQQPSKVRAS